MEKIRIFVYGTLMREQANSRVLEGETYLGPAKTKAMYSLLNLGGCPGMVPGDMSVSGELYEIRRGMLILLDMIEGHPNLYRRERIFLDNSEEVISYIFQNNFSFPCPEIASGDWRKR